MQVKFLTGNIYTALNDVAINPGTLYFTTDGKIVFDTEQNTIPVRLLMGNYTDTWTTPRNFQIGDTSKLVDGSSDTAWSLEEINADLAELNTVITYSSNMLLTTEWANVFTTNELNTLGNGTYAIQIYINTTDNNFINIEEYYSGIMSWYIDITEDTTANEIILHQAGKSAGTMHNIYLRTIRQSNGYLTLQICSDTNSEDYLDISFKFRRII